MTENIKIVVFSLDDQQYALHLATVERVLSAVEVTPLPKAPEIVLGVINVQGAIIPVVNVRRRFHIPEREMRLGDQMLIARTARRVVALVADSVLKVVDVSEDDIIAPKDIVPGTSYLDGIVKLEDGIVLIHDLDKFLSLEEEAMLDETLSQSQA
jgi:purine-binding chemotaxis protein CheW